MPEVDAPSQVRLSELVALLSLGIDLGFDQPMEHAIRQCLIALKLADALEMTQAERVVVYYSGLLAWVGCHTDAYEQAKWFGDDIQLKSEMAFKLDLGKKTTIPTLLMKHLGAGRPIASRLRVALAFFGEGWRDMQSLAENHYLAADGLAAQLGLGEDVRTSLQQSYERFDGKGWMGLRGEEIMLASRLVNLADVVEVYERNAGPAAARQVAQERSGTQFDPTLVQLFCDEQGRIFEGLPEQATWDTVIAAEPSLGHRLSDADLDAALEAIADFADLKSPWTLGHSRNVAALAREAGVVRGLSAVECQRLFRAGLLHDLGRLGVSNLIWDKPGALSHAETERVRLHPYLTERMLSYSPGLADLAPIAVEHHERLDGSGYPRGLKGPAISHAGRLLAAADAYQTMLEPRPHRAEMGRAAAGLRLRADVTAGRLDGEAVDAVLIAAGHHVPARRQWPAGLTQREVDVLRLLVRGLSHKAIADRLVISPKTARNHIEHIYSKTGASNRAQASLFAVKHSLLARGDSD